MFVDAVVCQVADPHWTLRDVGKKSDAFLLQAAKAVTSHGKFVLQQNGTEMTVHV